jgi:CheY-like chemotaxis protein
MDDEPDLIRPLVKELRAARCRVEVVSSGSAGLDRARQAIDDVIILDWKLPDVTGGAVLEQMRRERLDVPVVVLTAHENEDAAFLSAVLGAAAYLKKPIRGAVLLAKLEHVATGRITREVPTTHESEQGADRPGAFVSPSIQRLAQAIVAGVSLSEDPRTFGEWARVPGVTEDSLHRVCELLRLKGRAVLAFTRLLRAVTLVERHGATLAEVLEIAEPRTLARLLAKAGFGEGGAPRTTIGFLAEQKLLRHEALTRAVSALLRPASRP